MRSLSFVGLVLFASDLLSFCESGVSGDVFVSKKMFQEFQKQIFDRFDQINREVGEIKDIQLDQRDLGIRVISLEEGFSEQSVAITNLQVTDIGFEQRIGDLEDKILRNFTACESSPCDNGATCVDVNVDTFICVCRDGFFGISCSESYGDFTFLAGISANFVSPIPAPIVFDDAKINPDDHYNTTTGIYTVPLDGTYEFYVQIESYLETDNDWGFDLVVDGERITYTRHDASGSVEDFENVSLSSTILLQLSAGQQVWIEPLLLEGLHGSSSGVIYSWFSGHFKMQNDVLPSLLHSKIYVLILLVILRNKLSKINISF